MNVKNFTFAETRYNFTEIAYETILVLSFLLSRYDYF